MFDGEQTYPTSPRFQERGVTSAYEDVFLITVAIAAPPHQTRGKTDEAYFGPQQSVTTTDKIACQARARLGGR